MRAYATIFLNKTETSEEFFYLNLDTISILQVAIRDAGFDEVDVVDNDPKLGCVKIVATGKNMSITAKGQSLDSAVESFLNTLYPKVAKEIYERND